MRLAVLVALVILGGCGDGMSDEQRKAKAEADNQFIENLEPRNPPPQPVDPQTIGYPDIEEYNISGASCAFSPGTSMGAVLIAEDHQAWMKLEGRMMRLASDAGSPENPFGTHTRYDGKEYSLELSVDRDAGKQTGMEVVNYPGTLTVRDAYGQMVYRSEGTTQCGA